MTTKLFSRLLMLITVFASCSIYGMEQQLSNALPEKTLALTFKIPQKWHEDLSSPLDEMCSRQECECRNRKGANGEFIAERFFNGRYCFKQSTILIPQDPNNRLKHGFDELYMWDENKKTYYLVNESKVGDFSLRTGELNQQSLQWNYTTIDLYKIGQEIRDDFKKKLRSGNVVRTGTRIFSKDKGQTFLLELYWLHQGTAHNIYKTEKESFKLILNTLLTKISDKKFNIELSSHMQKEFEIK